MTFYKNYEKLIGLSPVAKCFLESVESLYEKSTILDFSCFDAKTLENITGDSNLRQSLEEILKICETGDITKKSKVLYLMHGILCCKNWEYLSKSDLDKIYKLTVGDGYEPKIESILKFQMNILSEFTFQNGVIYSLKNQCELDLKSFDEKKTKSLVIISYKENIAKLVEVQLINQDNILVPKIVCEECLMNKYKLHVIGENIYTECKIIHDKDCKNREIFITKIDKVPSDSKKELYEDRVKLINHQDCTSDDLKVITEKYTNKQ